MIDPPLCQRHRNRPSDLYDEQIIKLEKEGNTVKKLMTLSENRGTLELIQLYVQ